MKIGNPVAFQWATYYLRHRRAAFTEGELLYYPASVAEVVNTDRDLTYVVTHTPRNTDAIWAHGAFYLYEGSRCHVRFDNGWHAPEGGGQDWLRWSSGDGVLRIRTRESGAFVLTGELLC